MKPTKKQIADFYRDRTQIMVDLDNALRTPEGVVTMGQLFEITLQNTKAISELTENSKSQASSIDRLLIVAEKHSEKIGEFQLIKKEFEEFKECEDKKKGKRNDRVWEITTKFGWAIMGFICGVVVLVLTKLDIINLQK